MRKSKKMLAFAMTLVLAFTILAMPVSAATSAKYKAKHPIVLVHGLAGFGEYDDINKVVPYWGYTSGSIDKYIESYGNECYEASVGPISSAWDRACELYGQLTGTIVDYGAYHSAVHKHDQYGRDYTSAGYGKLMKSKWSASNPVNLVAHSFGGATCRTLIQLLSEGNADELSYAKKKGLQVSPLFKGGKSKWVYSLTTLAAPSNGSTVVDSMPNSVNFVGEMMGTASKALGISSFKGVYDFQLEHFGIYSSEDDTLDSLYNRIIKSDFLNHYDNAFNDLSVDKAIDMNADLEMQDNIYYFSFYGNRMKSNVLGGYSPTIRMWLPFKVSGRAMANYKGPTKGYYYDGYGTKRRKVSVKETSVNKANWHLSDGMVPVESGRYPFHYKNGIRVDDAHISAKVGVTAKKKGVWYVMPEVDGDHLTFCGGILNETRSSVQAFYRGVLENIVNCNG